MIIVVSVTVTAFPAWANTNCPGVAEVVINEMVSASVGVGSSSDLLQAARMNRRKTRV
ncbi:hypothetical protein LN893_14180 [Pontibacter sp. XAAS-A31]|nr:hypothetical protein [Pontibacter harenae]